MEKPLSRAPPVIGQLAVVIAVGVALEAGLATAQEPPPSPAPSEPAAVSEAASPPLHRPPAGDPRYALMLSGGPAAAGAPNFLLGGGAALGAVRGVRVLANLLVGTSTLRSMSTEGWPSVDGTTYVSAKVRTLAVMLELTGSWRVGAFELWAGGGAHHSVPQLEADYDIDVCQGDFSLLPPFCTGPVTRERETDAHHGSGVTAPMLGVGARLAVRDHLLVGLDLRYLVRGSSRLRELAVGREVGGTSVLMGVTWRVGRSGPARTR